MSPRRRRGHDRCPLDSRGCCHLGHFLHCRDLMILSWTVRLLYSQDTSSVHSEPQAVGSRAGLCPGWPPDTAPSSASPRGSWCWWRRPDSKPCLAPAQTLSHRKIGKDGKVPWGQRLCWKISGVRTREQAGQVPLPLTLGPRHRDIKPLGSTSVHTGKRGIRDTLGLSAAPSRFRSPAQSLSSPLK